MTRPLFLRLSPAEQSAYERAAGALGVARWARAVLAQAAGVTAIPRGRGPDAKVRAKRRVRCAFCRALVPVDEVAEGTPVGAGPIRYVCRHGR